MFIFKNTLDFNTGDMIFVIRQNQIVRMRIAEIQKIKNSTFYYAKPCFKSKKCYIFTQAMFGKTVFKRRIEAQNFIDSILK